MWRSPCAITLVLVSIAGCRASVVEPSLPPAWPEVEADKPLSRDRCVALATHSAPYAAAWKARILAARASLDQAELLPNPAASLSWEDFGLNQAASGPVQTTLSLAMALQDVFSRKRRAAAARHDLEAEEADVRKEIGRLAAEVSRAYDEIVAARRRVALAEELAAVAEKQRADVEKFVASGSSPRLDLERAEAELMQSQAQQAKSIAEARALELEFVFSLGFERPLALQLSDELASAGDAPSHDPGDASSHDPSDASSHDLGALLTKASTSRSEIAAAKARYDAELERLNLSADRVRFLPTVGGGVRTQGDELRGVATIDVELPIFDSGATAQRAQDASLLAAAAELRAAAHGVAREVCVALERLTAAEAYLSVHARDLAERRHALRERTERLFRAGETDYPELALARRDEVEARIALVDAELAVAAARLDLDAASGAIETRYARP